ncbi:hypothetical protein CYMTET_40867 [Cymbomonas tetramitiformis]|uniref:Uncharacterized protein n=1 Tax=Cymbomonas tetramitiformis TaxID=36881 RepID=A0AAE0C9E0_9CHLO|nr:hypothetical protein CYMTET_40867 [Cymbomonas tetramitiformis]
MVNKPTWREDIAFVMNKCMASDEEEGGGIFEISAGGLHNWFAKKYDRASYGPGDTAVPFLTNQPGARTRHIVHR